MPDYVVDPDTQELTRPKFLDPEELAGTISLVLEKEKGKAKEKAARLKERVKREFSTEKRGERFRELVAEITRS
jgi:glycosyltransferase involved in cell wall biosynthesis